MANVVVRSRRERPRSAVRRLCLCANRQRPASESARDDEDEDGGPGDGAAALLVQDEPGRVRSDEAAVVLGWAHGVEGEMAV